MPCLVAISAARFLAAAAFLALTSILTTRLTGKVLSDNPNL